MLGTYDLSKSAPEVALRGRAVMRSLLAMTIGAAAFFAVAGAAQAQECVGGYQMLKGEIPVLCDSGFGQPGYAAPQEEPLTTGSIGGISQPPSAAPVAAAPQTSPSGMKCVGGYTWRPGVENSYTTLPMPCN